MRSEAERTRGDRKIKGEGRMEPKCARLLSDARPSASADATKPSRREGRLRAVARWCKTRRSGVLSRSPPAASSWFRGHGVFVIAPVPPAAAHLVRPATDNWIQRMDSRQRISGTRASRRRIRK